MIERSGSGSIPLTNGSGSKRPKIIRIRQIRIRSTAFLILCIMQVTPLHLMLFASRKIELLPSGLILLFLLDDRKIWIRIHTSDWWIPIQEAKNHTDPTDPDPQHAAFFILLLILPPLCVMQVTLLHLMLFASRKIEQLLSGLILLFLLDDRKIWIRIHTSD